jgi:hypothetical protein
MYGGARPTIESENGPENLRVAKLATLTTVLHWIEDYTIIHELPVVWLGIVQPPLAVFWVLHKRQACAPRPHGIAMDWNRNAGGQENLPSPKSSQAASSSEGRVTTSSASIAR